ncbi:MAG: DUF3786 domain-containing protein [Armatimonadota bacterium]|nr:DUF3786 domain-containing protein [Armatimonadota bacterium]MCX7777095.1 DUF3786 domain-containing protein [Armatimonadota bacterium]MDW8025142.1 DUF3786 domain-containing protein [Armatimonadota bacterium]
MKTFNDVPKDEHEGHRIAYELAKESLGKLDIKLQCELAGAQLVEAEQKVSLNLLGDVYEISLPDCDVRCVTDEGAPIHLKILALHYLAQASGKPLTDRLIDFRELPGGIAYHVSFDSRVKKLLLSVFGDDDGSKLREAAKKLGAEDVNYGDVGLRIWALPRVPIIIAFWAADEEMPASISILFDSSISSYLTTEDVAVLGEHLAEKLVAAAKPKM